MVVPRVILRPSTPLRISALKGQHIPARGNALGNLANDNAGILKGWDNYRIVNGSTVGVGLIFGSVSLFQSEETAS